MKFLHCADVHLGGPNAQERMRVFAGMLDFCESEQVQVLLIAGDLFDAPRAEERARSEAFRLFAQHPQICVLIAAGNHDPNIPGGNYDGELPENVYVFGKKWSCAEIPEYGVRVWGASFAQDREPAFAPGPKKQNLLEGLYEIGVLHGDLTSANAESDYRAVTQKAIADTGVQYLALGHIHARSELGRAGRTHYAYSGCLQGAGFEDVGEKGAYLGELDQNGLRMSFVRLCGSMALEEKLDVTGCRNLADIAAKFDREIGAGKGHRLRLTLTGTVQGFKPDADALARLMADRAAEIRIEDETRAEADYEEIAQENTLRGAFVRRMLERIERETRAGQDASCARMALKYGLAAFEGEVKIDAD